MLKKKEKKVRAEKKNKSILPIAFLMALIVGVVLFFAMIHMEKQALSNYEKAEILVASTEIPKNVVFSEDNVPTYFTKKEIDKGIFPENAVTEEEQLYGFAPEFTISAGTAMSTNMLKSIDEKVAAMKEPRSVGAGSADLSQIVSGTVRPGDTVDIYIIANRKEDGIDYADEDLLYSDIYVLQAFDSAGTEIKNGDDTSVCERVNLLFENASVDEYYKAVAEGTIYYVKHVD